MGLESNIEKRYNKLVNGKYYSTINVESKSSEAILVGKKADTQLDPGYVWAPYIAVFDTIEIPTPIKARKKKIWEKDYEQFYDEQFE